jgi:HD-GYP domain-containing protein (c-di-GMP phosphodiesterase class II)
VLRNISNRSKSTRYILQGCSTISAGWIDDVVLRKNGKLTDEELGDIRKHPSIGAGILSGIKQMRDIVPGVLTHHEHIDGRGYPNGLKGEQIPLMGKVISLAISTR